MFINKAETLKDVLWICVFLTDRDDIETHIWPYISDDVIKRIISLICHNDSAIQLPALRVLGNLIADSDEIIKVNLNFKS